MPIRDVTDREHAVELGMQLHAKLREPYQLASVTGHLGISIDAAFFPDNAIIPEVLLAYTDTAIYTMRKKINASLLELEVTESVLIEDVNTAAEKRRSQKSRFDDQH